MSDDREFSQYSKKTWESKRVEAPQPYITFREYVLDVVENIHRRREEFEDLVKVFTLEEIDAVVEGKLVIEAKDILRRGVEKLK